MTTATDEETLGWGDRDHLQYAAENRWPLLTFDDDFLRFAEDEEFDVEHQGIVFI